MSRVDQFCARRGQCPETTPRVFLLLPARNGSTDRERDRLVTLGYGEGVPVGERAIVSPTVKPIDEDEERALVRAACDNVGAFDALYVRYRTRVYWYLRARSATDEDAADLTQQTFMQAWDALPRYQERGVSFVAWLFRIAHNLALNAARRHRPTLDWAALPETALGVAADEPETLAVQQEATARLRALIAGLDPEQRELLTLRFVAGLTVREIASVLGIGEEATKKRLQRTIRALKERFDEA